MNLFLNRQGHSQSRGAGQLEADSARRSPREQDHVEDVAAATTTVGDGQSGRANGSNKRC